MLLELLCTILTNFALLDWYDTAASIQDTLLVSFQRSAISTFSSHLTYSELSYLYVKSLFLIIDMYNATHHLVCLQ